MSGRSVLCDELKALHQGQKTGRLFAYCEGNERGVRVRPAEADFSAGEMVSFRFSELENTEALTAIASKKVDRVVFVPTDTATTVAAGQLPTLPEIIALLEGEVDPAQRAATPSAVMPVTDSTDDLINDVCSALTEIYGESAPVKLKQLAAVYPPQERPAEFLHQCRREITDALVGPSAELLYGSLLERIPAEPLFTDHRVR